MKYPNYVLFATDEGIQAIKNNTQFDNVKCVYELDNTFKVFDNNSRYFIIQDGIIQKEEVKKIVEAYGKQLCPIHPLGYGDGQKLIGFSHNTPDNTLPIIWCEDNNTSWKPIFKRYSKIY